MIILTNKAGPSSASFMILLVVSISTVFGCGVLPGGQTSTRTFTASGPSNLPVIAVYTDNNAVPALIPGIATSAGAVQAFAQHFAMQTVIDVLEIEGRRALLPDFVISNILGQLQVNTTYEPLLCSMFKKPEVNQDATESCIIVGSTVTGICTAEARQPQQKNCHIVAKAIDGKHLSLSGTLTTTNIIMANWSRSMWQNVVDRALRMLRSGPFGSHLYTMASDDMTAVFRCLSKQLEDSPTYHSILAPMGYGSGRNGYLIAIHVFTPCSLLGDDQELSSSGMNNLHVTNPFSTNPSHVMVDTKSKIRRKTKGMLLKVF
ncbi:hypothetical protein KIN20_010897 [Parelaphostrongylus tenuis]|uniref:Uncharacterized protein n=1 Tax=Parelaphostrongylus tenuis TaxID=148309 RepID=A0AAD5MC32_PARTN|nr:hypothetical protein KIN20_010897 [Parelaphostrongylus tenuis]